MPSRSIEHGEPEDAPAKDAEHGKQIDQALGGTQQLLHGAEEELYGDSAYHSKQLKQLAEHAGLQFNVNQRQFKHRPLTQRQKARNRRLAKITRGG